MVEDLSARLAAALNTIKEYEQKITIFEAKNIELENEMATLNFLLQEKQN